MLCPMLLSATLFAPAKPPVLTGADGSVVARAAGRGQEWRPLKQGLSVPLQDTLVCLPDASIETADRGVRLTAVADYDGLSPLPVLETALSVGDAGPDKFDVELLRGRLDLRNLRTDGPAQVTVRFRDETWVLTLETPDTAVALERFGRWPAGAKFTLKPTAADEPAVAVELVVRTGRVTLETARHKYTLSAPPGPALLEWDSLTRTDSAPQRVAKLPEWAAERPEVTPAAKAYRERLEEYRKARLTDGIAAATDAFYASGDPIKERIALISMGALDDLPRLARALAESRSAGVWDFGVVVLRHWLGREPGLEQSLYQFLSRERQYSPAHSRIICELLLGFGEAESSDPLTYEILIEYLRHEKPAVRNLAGWHLSRLAPHLRGKIPYRPNASPEDIERTYQAWKAEVPSGAAPRKP